MDRASRRQDSKEIKSIVKKAKVLMSGWLSNLDHTPTKEELGAWQAGYVAGLNQNEYI
jgi:hypothetical protein